ncbi:MAG: hypothetical protein ACP5GJ_01265 [Nanopusillaceae archaeon]|jgi:hypothetical protein
MKKLKIEDIITISAIFAIIFYLLFKGYISSSTNNNKLYIYKNNENITIASPYSIQQLSFIPIISNVSLYEEEKNYKYYLLIYDPTLSGYYNSEILYIYLKIPYLIPICSYYYPSPGCKYFFENNSITNDYIYLYSSSNYGYNYTFILPENQTLLLYIVSTNNKYGIIVENNTIYILSNNSEIAEEVATKFVLYWYGIINS